MTASGMVGLGDRLPAAGFDGYIQKPTDLETFMALIERFLTSAPVDVRTVAT
jgi:CheY-like chemotaxis protein